MGCILFKLPLLSLLPLLLVLLLPLSTRTQNQKAFGTSKCNVGFRPKSTHRIGRYLHICVFYLYIAADTHGQPAKQMNIIICLLDLTRNRWLSEYIWSYLLGMQPNATIAKCSNEWKSCSKCVQCCSTSFSLYAFVVDYSLQKGLQLQPL